MKTVKKIISGGQTGADQGGLEAAKRFGIPTGGWIPKGFLTIPSMRLLLALTYREVELGESRALSDLLYELSRQRQGERIKLTRLSREETAELLRAMFAEQPSPQLVDLIFRETEGNPFFIEEVCKALIEEGKLSRISGRWQRPDMSELENPQNVKLAIQARVNKLPDPAQDTLRLDAVLGREFDFDTLHAMSDLDEDNLIDMLEIAQHAQRIGAGSPARLSWFSAASWHTARTAE